MLYGLDLAGDDRVPDLWTSATQVGVRWNQVVAVRLALLVSAVPSSRGSLPDEATYLLFGSDYSDANDLGTVVNAAGQDATYRNRLRKAFTTTLFLRNRTFASDV